MTAQGKATIKSYFEEGDRPTQSQFSDLIDSYVDSLSVCGNIAALASAGGTGLINIISSASANLVTSGTVGLQILQATTTASATSSLGGGTVGVQVFQAPTTAAAQNALGGGAIGKFLFETVTTASATSQLGGGTVGVQIFQAPTTAAAQSLFSFPQCLVYQTSATSLGNGAWTTLQFDTEAFDDAGWHSTTVNNSRITFDFSGRVQVIANFDAAQVANISVGSRILLNGSTVLGKSFVVMGAVPASAVQLQSLVCVVSVGNGDYVEMQGFQNNGTQPSGTGLGGTTFAAVRIK